MNKVWLLLCPFHRVIESFVQVNTFGKWRSGFKPGSGKCLLSHMKWSEVAQSCPTLCDSMNCSLPSFSIHGLFQARVLEWTAISFSRGSSQPRDRTWVSCIAGRCFTVWATREAPIYIYKYLLYICMCVCVCVCGWHYQVYIQSVPYDIYSLFIRNWS